MIWDIWGRKKNEYTQAKLTRAFNDIATDFNVLNLTSNIESRIKFLDLTVKFHEIFVNVVKEN